eukprot:CAMPEP_0198109494 /NCGR_PEP_ID=MMETSP1442-20131203/1545_1 /TAXON_ID= /ORGANISM="Craspedostauros australis, Strain CCMP3328" /LENGTH=202 /DNA_ID=CAMNT_0043765189 /DNA_START=87 /DNA_END=695 /DNA_ORIENTATION=+
MSAPKDRTYYDILAGGIDFPGTQNPPLHPWIMMVTKTVLLRASCPESYRPAHQCITRILRVDASWFFFLRRCRTVDLDSIRFWLRIYLAAYKAMSPRMNGREIPASPARAIGSFSSSVILSVLVWKNSSGSESLERDSRSGSPMNPLSLVVVVAALTLKAWPTDERGTNACDMRTQLMATTTARTVENVTDFILLIGVAVVE